ncbi:hypothetical protein H0H93_006243 [Arthromyces matolae]|nr:hypothetical protein H0H93_006243 [Arthromyces matolae]
MQGTYLWNLFQSDERLDVGSDPEFSDPKLRGPFSTSTSRAVARAHAREMISKYEEILHYYKGRHNALTDTSRLPAEILLVIFHEVVNNSFEMEYKFDTAWRLGFLKKVTQVCSHWRKVAMSAPSLWAHIVVEDSPWTMEMIERSKQAPLTIVYGANVASGMSTYIKTVFTSIGVLGELVSSHSHRIKTLVLELDASHYHSYRTKSDVVGTFQTLLATLLTTAPILERLEIFFIGEHPNEKINVQAPVEMTTGLPRLRHLRLHKCNIAWDRLRLESLRFLDIHDLPDSSQVSISHILMILQHTPFLEHLEAWGIQPSNASDREALRPMRPLILRYLRDLKISAALSDWVLLLDHIKFAKAPWLIDIDICPSPIDEVDQPTLISFMHTLAHRIDEGVDTPIVNLDIMRYSFSGINIVPTSYSVATDANKYPSIVMRKYFNLRYLMEGLSLEQLISLAVSSVKIAHEWLLFARLPNLKRIQVDDDSLHPQSVMQVLSFGLAPGSNVPPTFLNLTDFVIRGWDLYNEELDERLKSLKNCFKLRKEAGLPLENLQLTNCKGLTEADIMYFRRIITNVEWDQENAPSRESSISTSGAVADHRGI